MDEERGKEHHPQNEHGGVDQLHGFVPGAQLLTAGVGHNEVDLHEIWFLLKHNRSGLKMWQKLFLRTAET